LFSSEPPRSQKIVGSEQASQPSRLTEKVQRTTGPRFAQPRRTFDDQSPNGLPVLGREPPEEEPLDDLAQSRLGFLGRESSASGLGGKVSNGAGGSRSDSEIRRSVAMGEAERALTPSG